MYYQHGEDRSATLVSVVPHLPALADLTIRFLDQQDLDDADTDGEGLPRCRELSELHSRSLTRLRVDLFDNPDADGGNTLRLVGLPELRSCQLRDGMGPRVKPPLGLGIDAASFRGAPQLRSLRIKYVKGLQLRDSSLEQLTRLTSLTIEWCDLRKVPVGVAALGATLRVLDLTGNGPLQLDEAGVAAILQCSRLTTLSLHKPCIRAWQIKLGPDAWQPIAQHMDEEGYTPAQYSMESIWHLMRLPPAFRDRHSRDLPLCVLEEEHERYLGSNRGEHSDF